MDAENTLIIEDRYANTPYRAKPPVDSEQNIIDKSIIIADMETKVSFTRPLSTKDPNDMDVIGCHYFLFAGGPLNPSKNDIDYHGATKTSSSQQICIDECGECKTEMSWTCNDVITVLQLRRGNRDNLNKIFLIFL